MVFVCEETVVLTGDTLMQTQRRGKPMYISLVQRKVFLPVAEGWSWTDL